MVYKSLSFVNEFFYNNLAYVVAIILGLSILLTGLVINSFHVPGFKLGDSSVVRYFNRVTGILHKATSLFPLKLMKKEISTGLSITLLEENSINFISSLITLGTASVSLIIAISLYNIGQLWYSKILLVGMGLLLPYYLTTLLLDLYRYHIGRTIPKLIDEFRSSFIRHNKIRPAMKECSLYIDKGLGKIISRAADSTFIEQSLNLLKNRFDNVWFNIFVVLLLNYKENGGELIDQLYRLNRTMTRYNNIEKKKNKRLIWYEVFTVGASVFSIPAIFLVNSLILGNDQSVLIDAKTNVIISQVIGFSILSLIIIRILRRM